MSINKLFVPVFGGEEDAVALELAAEVGCYFHAHLEVAAGGLQLGKSGHGRHPEGREAAGNDRHTLFERWRTKHRLELEQEELEFSSERVYRGLASASWLDLGSGSDETLAHRAKFADLVCLAVKPGDSRSRAARALDTLLFSSGRPALLQPMRHDGAEPFTMGQPIVIGWNGRVEAVRALTGALPLVKVSRQVEVLSIGEESVNAFDAYEVVKYLRWSGIQATASGIAVKDWTGGDVVDAAIDQGAKLLVMGARRGGSTTPHMLETLPIAALMAA